MRICVGVRASGAPILASTSSNLENVMLGAAILKMMLRKRFSRFALVCVISNTFDCLARDLRSGFRV